MASGFTGEPVLPGTRSGATTSMNSHRLSLAAVSAELRYPLTSPLRVGRFGVKAFVDSAAAWNAGERLRDQRFTRGVGGGVYVGAAAIIMDLDLAWPEEGKPRAHFGLGVTC